MTTPQIRTNPENHSLTNATETRQTSRSRYVLAFTSIRQTTDENHQQQPAAISTSNQHQHHHQQQSASAAISISSTITSSNQHQQKAPAPATRREGAVPPPEASTRCLRVASGVIHYMKSNERGCTLVDDKSRNLSCFVILLCDCNILLYCVILYYYSVI